MGVFSPTGILGVSTEVKFQMFGYILISHLKPIPLTWFVRFLICRYTADIVFRSSLRSGRYARHSIDLTGPCSSSNFRSCLDGLRLVTGMFQDALGPFGDAFTREPIKHLRRGVEIKIVAPKVPAHRPITSAVDSAELIEISAYSRALERASEIQYVSLLESRVLLRHLIISQARKSSLERRVIGQSCQG